MNRRFFSSRTVDGSKLQLTPDESHHLLHVLRAEPGSEWTVFDGSGCEFRVRLVGGCKRTAELDVIEQLQVDRELATHLHLAVAFPKGDRQKWLIEKCVELGVQELTPLNSSRSVVKLSSASIEKFQRNVVESSKQCGRNRLMQLNRPIDFATLIGQANGPMDVGCRWIADPNGCSISIRMADIGSKTTAIVGPEGGFSDEELESAAANNWDAVSLGSRILRIETAAITIAAAIGMNEAK